MILLSGIALVPVLTSLVPRYHSLIEVRYEKSEPDAMLGLAYDSMELIRFDLRVTLLEYGLAPAILSSP